MDNLQPFIDSVLRPVTQNTVAGIIVSGIILSLIYARAVPILFLNSIVIGSCFFLIMYTIRRFLNGVDSAGGYIGTWLLFILFLVTMKLTSIVFNKYKR